jgi:hypothetical protein
MLVESIDINPAARASSPAVPARTASNIAA